jgi:hypothetical protein
MPTVDSYGLVQKKEDVSDIISNISPSKTPFTSLTGKETVHNWAFDWMEDILRASANNAQVEGFTATPTARTQPTMKENVTQIFQDTFEVTGTTDAVSIYGRNKETALQANKAAKALKLDLEHAYVGNQQAKVKPVDNTTARKMASVQAQIASGNRVITGGPSTAPTEANLLSALTLSYKAGAEPTIIMVTPDDSLIVADFAKASGRTRNIHNGSADRKIVNVVDLYVSPFGEQKVVLNRELMLSDMLILDPSLWNKVALKGRDWFTEKLAKTGDKEATMMVGEFSLKCKNSNGNAWVTRSAT